MYKFILKDDFKTIATEFDLTVLSSNNDKIIEQCNKIAIDEAAAYLSVKYDLVKLFKDPVEYNSGSTYLIEDRIYTITGLSGETYTHYTCSASGATSGTSITDTNFFTEEDDRDQKLLEVCMTISLFYIHKRLSPNNIPTFRVISYDGNGDDKIMSAIKWLSLVQSGTLNPYNWPIVEDDGDDSGYEPDFELIGNDPSDGIMFGNDLGDEYHHYNNLYDKNIIRKDDE